jgi:hypothetical protein
MDGDDYHALLATGDAVASNAKENSGVESDTAPATSSSNAATRKIMKKGVPMLQDY